jgi:uncharacterized membrane protein YidH (DUF202 family)
MRLLSFSLAVLLTLGGLYLAMFAGNGFLDHLSAMSDAQQRMVGGALVSFSAVILAIGGLLKRRRARENEGA